MNSQYKNLDTLVFNKWVSFLGRDYATLKAWFVEGGGAPK